MQDAHLAHSDYPGMYLRIHNIHLISIVGQKFLRLLQVQNLSNSQIYNVFISLNNVFTIDYHGSSHFFMEHALIKRYRTHHDRLKI